MISQTYWKKAFLDVCVTSLQLKKLRIIGQFVHFILGMGGYWNIKPKLVK